MRAYAGQQTVNATGAARPVTFGTCASPAGSWSIALMGEPTADRKHGRPRRTSVSMQ